MAYASFAHGLVLSLKVADIPYSNSDGRTDTEGKSLRLSYFFLCEIMLASPLNKK
jgi:hypothetical protein